MDQAFRNILKFNRLKLAALKLFLGIFLVWVVVAGGLTLIRLVGERRLQRFLEIIWVKPKDAKFPLAPPEGEFAKAPSEIG
ncbi:MAG: hypothetical protein JSW39_15665 [Desulfobacterales bacterium]|nr:MAG: hypothetical protein JSW39_15665 [Desulfobacterales bacterium]